jgi:hypothetical protein
LFLRDRDFDLVLYPIRLTDLKKSNCVTRTDVAIQAIPSYEG